MLFSDSAQFVFRMCSKFCICTLWSVHKTPKHKLLYRMCRVVDSTIFPCEAHFTLYKSNGSPLVCFARGRTAYDYNNFGHCAWIWLSTTCTDNAELKHHSHLSVFLSHLIMDNYWLLTTYHGEVNINSWIKSLKIALKPAWPPWPICQISVANWQLQWAVPGTASNSRGWFCQTKCPIWEYLSLVWRC